MAAGDLSKRRHVIGVVVVLVFLVVPNLTRALAGSNEIAASEVIFLAGIVVLVPWTLTLGLRWGERRRLSTVWTVTIGYGLAALAGAAASVAWQGVASLGVVDTFNQDTWYEAAGNGFYLGMAMVGIWGMFMLMPRAVQDARDREREHQELHRDAERSRVRAALEPHFVLNTLNAISGLIGEHPEMARELVGDLGDLLRDVVLLTEQETQPAAAEVQWLQRYGRLFEARHQGRLVVEWTVDPAAAAMPVPVLLLQPLVENAIQHGALCRPGGGRVRVDLRVEYRGLRWTVEDDGPGMPSEVRDDARGIALIRRRLACDAPGSTLTIEPVSTGGTRATLHLVAA